MGVSPMEQQEYSFTIAFSSYLLRGLGDGRPQPAEHQFIHWSVGKIIIKYSSTLWHVGKQVLLYSLACRH
jgi:hypothetical protein